MALHLEFPEPLIIIRCMVSKLSALLIIDMQNDFVLPGAPACVSGALSTVGTIREMMTWFREKRFPVIHVIREYRADGSDVEITRRSAFLHGPSYVVPGTSGAAIIAGLEPAVGETVIVKQRFSAFLQTELDFILRRAGVGQVVITGTQYPNCIRATAFDAISYDYPATVITDATSAATAEIAEANIRDLRNVGITCISSQEFFALFPEGQPSNSLPD